MDTHFHLACRYLMGTLLLLTGCLSHADGALDLPYMSPLQMQSSGDSANGEAAHALYGRVTKTMDSGGYTYVQLDTGKQQVWAAGPITPVKQGDAVKIETNMPMRHFHSDTLKRNFDLVYFSNTITVAGSMRSNTSTGMNPHHGMPQGSATVPLTDIKKAAHGKTIAEIFSERKQLAGKQVRVRGKVIKNIGNIYGMNWLHIQDSSSQKTLLVLTADKASSDVVLVEGTVTLDKDNGVGHVYEVALVNARVLDKK